MHQEGSSCGVLRGWSVEKAEQLEEPSFNMVCPQKSDLEHR